MQSGKHYLSLMQERFEVQAFTADMNSRLKLNYLTAFIQEAAWKHAQHLDFGSDYMHQNQVAWMLARLRLEMNEYPVWQDEIQIETWPKSIEGPCYVRDFYINDINGRRLGAATSYWLLVDTVNKRPKIPDPHTHFLMQKDKHAINMRLAKMKADCNLQVAKITAGFGDIDLNNHVNSNKYVEWITNILPFDKLKNRQIGTFQINYIHELLYGEEIIFKTEEKEESGRIIIEGWKGKNLCVQSFIKWA